MRLIPKPTPHRTFDFKVKRTGEMCHDHRMEMRRQKRVDGQSTKTIRVVVISRAKRHAAAISRTESDVVRVLTARLTSGIAKAQTQKRGSTDLLGF